MQHANLPNDFRAKLLKPSNGGNSCICRHRLFGDKGVHSFRPMSLIRRSGDNIWREHHGGTDSFNDMWRLSLNT